MELSCILSHRLQNHAYRHDPFMESTVERLLGVTLYTVQADLDVFAFTW